MNLSADKESSCIDPGGFRQASDPLIKLLSNQNMSCSDLLNKINTFRKTVMERERKRQSGDPYVCLLYWLSESLESVLRTNIL